ncbi:MAG: 3'-5' exonuclease [Cyclobacteriaceae bacterium]|nr:3'-5' exonuclease [Cyclobacteriaceae bacterium]
MKLILKNPLAFFDLETTGTNISQDRIVEISILKVMPDGQEHLQTYKINPEIPIPAESSAIHGIYDEDVAEAPTFKSMAKSFLKFLEGCDLAGFNIIKFDVPILVEEFLRAGTDFDISKRKLIDAQKIFHLMEKRNLSAAYKFYCDKILTDAHSAEADTLATYEILKKQIEIYEGQKVEDLQGNAMGYIQNDIAVLHELTFTKMVDLAGRMVFNDKGIEVFNFGKHKGKAVQEILSKEPSYYDWMMNGDFPLDTKRKLTEIKLRSFNNR